MTPPDAATSDGSTTEPATTGTMDSETGDSETGEEVPDEAECGNGIVERSEECDDGDSVPDDECTNDCTLPICGDGIIQPGESCDAGADNGPNSACLDSCQDNVCGDGFVGPGELCDDGNDDDDDTCTNECSVTSCGDGILDADLGEQCDDGNDDNADGCLTVCVSASCGDGFIQLEDIDGQPLPSDQLEECDDGPQNSNSAGCTNVCKLASCGDGLVHQGVESCDNGTENGPDGACLDDCEENVCGDGWQGPEEACDDGNVSANDGCSSDCTLEGCGDGEIQIGEGCDDGQNGDQDDGCTDECQLEACGDGFVQSGEQCDLGGDNSDSGACTSSCADAICGDGQVWENHEECDNGPSNDDGAECTSMCVDAICGDGLVGPGEGCDDGNNSAADGCGPTCISEECGNGIVDPNEACDDGNDDEDQCTNACTIPVPCDGPYVSKDTCVPGDQCGTVARPWCSISAGIDNAIAGPIRVASAGTAYYAAVSMKSGFDVLGGYEPSFLGPRDPNPQTNETTILWTTSAVQWNGTTTATLDGFTVETEGPWDGDPIPVSHEIVRISGSANATLENVRVRPRNTDTYATTDAFGIEVRTGTGGSVLIAGLTEITSPKASLASIAVGVDPNASSVSVDILDSVLLGGPAQNSYGVRDLGQGFLSLTNAVVSAGAGSVSSTGVRVAHGSHGGTDVEQSQVHGGVSKLAVGIHHGAGDHLGIVGGSTIGGGLLNAATISIGVLTEGVGELHIGAAEVTGSDVVGTTATAIGVDVRNLGLAATLAAIEGSNIEGGSGASTRTGVSNQGASLELTTSVVRGTSAGNRFARGVRLVGQFPDGATALIADNVEISGGLGGVGIEVTAVVPVTISNNTLIRGSALPAGSSTGVRFILAGSGHAVTGNSQILGGPGGAGYATSAGVHIQGSEVTVSDNAEIVGNNLVDQPANESYGIELRNGGLIAEDNGLIMGGYTATYGSRCGGVHAWTVTDAEHNDVLLRGNTIVAGTSTSYANGVWFERRHTAVVEHNYVKICPFAANDARCSQHGSTAAIMTVGDEGSHYANNYFFGQKVGCLIGCPGLTCGYFETANLTFESNLCRIFDGNAALIVESVYNPGGSGEAIFRNNILHVEEWPGVGIRYYTKLGPDHVFQLYNNDLLTGADHLLQRENTNEHTDTIEGVHAFSGAGYLIAAGNVSIDPSYVDPVYLSPTAAGYHLDDTCALEDLAQVSPLVNVDFDGDARGDGGPSGLPEIGPDECQ